MKFIDLFVISALAIASCAGPCLAGDPPGAKPAANAPADTKSATGSINNIDPNEGKVSIRTGGDPKTAQIIVLSVSAQTKVTRGGQDVTLGQLETGDSVSVTYVVDVDANDDAVTIAATKANPPKGKGKKARR